jgi:hypothetical protein
MANLSDNERVQYDGRWGMSNDDLVCAACCGRVADGGCPTCRASRASLPADRLPAEAFLVLAAVLAVLALLAAHL